MDRTDAAWAGLEFNYVWFGLDMPSVAEVRHGLAMAMEAAPVLGSTLDLERGRFLPCSPGRREQRAEELVSEDFDDDQDPPEAVARFMQPLGTDPLQFAVGRHGLAVRWSHALGDAFTCFGVVKHLLAQARTAQPLDPPWDILGPRERDLLAARSVLQRPRSVLHAVRHREELSGGRYELASLRTIGEEHHAVIARSDHDFLPALAEERSRRGVRTSTAAIMLTGFRRHLAHRLVEPLPGAEVIFDVRAMSPRSHRAFGNWAAGVYVRPEDDDDVESVYAASREVRERGFPFIAAAAARRRAELQGAGDRMVLAPLGRPRLTLTYLNRGGPQRDFPWQPGLDHVLVNETTPNGLDTITLVGREREDRLDLSICHYPSRWPVQDVEHVVEDFLADPWGDSVAGAGR